MSPYIPYSLRNGDLLGWMKYNFWMLSFRCPSPVTVWWPVSCWSMISAGQIQESLPNKLCLKYKLPVLQVRIDRLLLLLSTFTFLLDMIEVWYFISFRIKRAILSSYGLGEFTHVCVFWLHIVKTFLRVSGFFFFCTLFITASPATLQIFHCVGVSRLLIWCAYIGIF